MEPAIWQQDAKKDAGNFGDPVGFGQYTEDVHNKEPNNGRMAMCAVLGDVAADLLTGKDGIQQIGFGAVRERGSRVVRRTTAAAAEEPKPLPVFHPASQL
jgi:hypothetical protein